MCPQNLTKLFWIITVSVQDNVVGLISFVQHAVPPADIGLEAFLEPDSVIEEGSDVTVCCRVTSYRVSPRRLMVMVHYNGHNYGTQLKLKDISVYEYRTVIPSVTESSSGDYFCIIDQLLDGHCINKTQGVHLNVTSTSDNNNYGERRCLLAFKLYFLF